MFCDKSEEVCDRSCVRNRVLRVDYEFPNYNYVITRGKNRENKGSISEFIQSIRDMTSGFYKANRNSFFNHSSSAPGPSTVLLLTKVTNSISKTNAVLPHFGKADSHCKKRGQIGYATTGTGLFSERCIHKRLGLYIEDSEQGFSGPKRNRIYISISWNL